MKYEIHGKSFGFLGLLEKYILSVINKSEILVKSNARAYATATKFSKRKVVK